MKIFSTLLEAFFPFRCHACSSLTGLGEVICGECLAKLENILEPPVLVGDTLCDFPVCSLSGYDSFVADIIKLIKYRPSKKMLFRVAKIIQNKNLLADFHQQNNVFVPVPMHQSREFKRGFNQAELFAKLFAEITSNHYSPVIKRVVATRAQADCDEEERLTNLDDAFALENGLVRKAFVHKKIILVDDVATTGTTLQKCKQKLEELFPQAVTALVISHSYRKNPSSRKTGRLF